MDPCEYCEISDYCIDDDGRREERCDMMMERLIERGREDFYREWFIYIKEYSD